MKHGSVGLIKNLIKLLQSNLKTRKKLGILDFPSFRNDDIERLYWLDIENSSFIAKIWQFWNKNPFLEDNQVATQTSMTANDLKEELVIEGDGSRDLLVAGTTLYGDNFEYRDGQLELLLELYHGVTKCSLVRALPGYGKTAFFCLPLLALKQSHPRKVVSFVFVPNTFSQHEMRERLESQFFNVGLLHIMLENGFNVGDCDLECELYIGTFDDLKSNNFTYLINNWPSICRGKILGMIIFDEFPTHNEEFVKKIDLRKINFSVAWKVLVTTGTSTKAEIIKTLQDVGYHQDATSSIEPSEISRKAAFYDLVSIPPLTKVIKKFFKEKYLGQILLYVQCIVNRMTAYDDHSQIIIICKDELQFSHLDYKCSFNSPHFIMDPSVEYAWNKGYSFFSSRKCRTLISTKERFQSIDVDTIKLVIFVDVLPTIQEYIQITGRLRDGGICLTFWTDDSSKQDDSILPSVCIEKQLAAFYDLPITGHSGCCNVEGEAISTSSRELWNFLITKNTMPNRSIRDWQELDATSFQLTSYSDSPILAITSLRMGLGHDETRTDIIMISDRFFVVNGFIVDTSCRVTGKDIIRPKDFVLERCSEFEKASFAKQTILI